MTIERSSCPLGIRNATALAGNKKFGSYDLLQRFPNLILA